MIKSLLTATVLITLSATSSLAELIKVSNDVYVADDADGNIHRIEYIRQDHEGDVQVKVNVRDEETYYWVNCKEDRISIGGDGFQGWDYVDHRKMQGYYSDVACGRK